jgi:hypothetical protein
MNGHRPLADRMPGWADDWQWACRLALDVDSFLRLLSGGHVLVEELDRYWIAEYRRLFPQRIKKVPVP